MDFGDITVKKLSTNQDELLTVDSNGLIVSTGINKNDVADASDVAANASDINTINTVTVPALQSDIDANTTAIAANSSDIGVNAGNIATNTAAISNLSKYGLYYNNSALTINTNTATILTLNATQRSSPTITLSSNQISVTKSGEYIIEADTSFIVTTGTSRTRIEVWLALNGVEIAGTRGIIHLERTPHGTSATTRTILTLNTTDNITLVCQRLTGTSKCSQFENGTRLFIRKGFV